MTLREAIDRADALCPNGYEEHEKRAWLSALDGQIYEEVIITHAGAGDWNPYTDLTPETTRLLAAAPYDDLYIPYLETKIDYYNGETARYNNAAAVFNTRLSEYKSWYNRTHTPNSAQVRYFTKGEAQNGGPLSE